MTKMFGNGKPRGGFVHPTSARTMESRSNRTGGFESHRPRYDDFIADDTTLQDSVYTVPSRQAGESTSGSHESQATTVKASPRRPFEFMKDIAPRLRSHKQAVANCSPNSKTAVQNIPTEVHTTQTSPVRERRGPPSSEFRVDGTSARRSPAVKPRTSQELVEAPAIVSPHNSYNRVQFSFADDTQLLKRSVATRKDENSVSSSDIISIEYSEDGEGLGFEVESGPPDGTIPLPPDDDMSGNNDDDGDDDDDSSTGLSMVLRNSANVSDGKLLDDSSPGALRLTADGLKRHERKTFKEALVQKEEDNLSSWKLKKDTSKWLQQSDGLRAGSLPVAGASRNQGDRSRRGTSTKKTHSAAYLNKTEPDLGESEAGNLSPKEASAKAKPKSLKKVLSIFKKKGESSAASKALLEKERLEAEETKRMNKKVMEKKEKDRIARKRRAFLEQQRSLEASRETPTTYASYGQSSIVSMDLVKSLSGQSKASTVDLSTLSSAPPLPPCAVCAVGERTHIASPCMHFSFCGKCAARLGRNGAAVCPVCSTPGVSFAMVSV